MNDNPQKMPPVPPFVRFVASAVPMVFDNSLSYYEALCALWKYIQSMTDVINNNATLEEEYIEKFNELKSFVDHYFDNLDVQEEINNKLDEMADSGQLADIISVYVDEKLQLIFPEYGMDGTDTLGDCSIIKVGNSTMMIDCFSEQQDTFDSIVATLEDNNIETLNYLLITHYHADHMGNIYNLINGGYLDGATVILPRDITRWEGVYNGNAIKTALDTAGIDYVVCSNQTISLGDASIQLFNGSETDYAYYDTQDCEYNDYSIMCNVLYHGRKLLFTGDASLTACRYVTPLYLYSDYDFLKDNHHGYIEFDSGYAKKVNPDYVLISTSKGMLNKNLSRWASLSTYWQQACSSKVYLQGYQADSFSFEVGYAGVKCIDGYSVQGFGGRGNLNYYVDGNTNSKIRTGSLNNPFKTLAEANALIGKNEDSATITLNIVNTPADTENVYFSGFKNLVIECNNKLVNTLVEFFNCGNIKIKKGNFGGILGFHNTNFADITDGFTSTSSSYSAIEFYNTNASIAGAFSASGFTNQMVRIDNSQLYFAISSLTVTLNGHRMFAGNGANINFSADAITALSSYTFVGQIMSLDMYKNSKLSGNSEQLRRIFYNASGTTTGITCTENIWIYPYVVVKYGDGNNQRRIEKFSTSGVWNFKTSFLSSDGNTLYFDTCAATFSDKTVTLARNRELAFTTSGMTLGSQNTIKIYEIYGSI